MKPKVIAIAGPTASGKTKMAVELALQIGGEVVSADSRLVYKGFNIAAAKPTEEEMRGIPHYMMDIVEPEYDFSAANYYDGAKIAINNILNKGKIPIIAGGTGLYFRILLENYDLPRVESKPELRKELDLREKSDLLLELKSLDRASYEKMVNSDKRRIVRALEIIKTLNVKLSEAATLKEPEYNVEWKIPLIESREWLYERINKRVDNMVKNGIVEETEALLQKHGRIRNITDTIGYKEIITYLDGNASLEDAVEKLKQHTRNYAKRQLTWFRRNPELKICC